MSKRPLCVTRSEIELGNISNRLHYSLQQMLELSKGDPGASYRAHDALGIAMSVMLKAFSINTYYNGLLNLTEEEIKAVLPEFRGALKIVDALVAAGVTLPLPITSQIVVKMFRAVPGRFKRSRKSAKVASKKVRD
jgi:hypothetical protein